jgi:putative membrane protein
MTGSVRRLHPLSVPYRAVSSVIRFAWVLIIGVVSTSQFDGFVGGAGALLFGVLLLALAYQVAYVRRFAYELTADTFDLQSGVVSRTNREIPYGRVQNVDVSRNPVQRVLGIAEVRIETAGGGETEAHLRYVDSGEATRLQREIGQRKRGETTDATGRETPPEPDTELFAITSRGLFLLGVVRVDLRLLSFATVVVPFLVPSVSETFPLVDLLRAAPLLLGGIVLLALVVSSLAAVASYYKFVLSRGDGELRYRRGLLQEYSGTIPLDKVQSVVITENALARRVGYASLEVETAGYAPGGSDGSGAQSAVPLARRDRVLELAKQVEPFTDVDFERPPKRARTRYVVRYTLVIVVLTAIFAGLVQFTGLPVPFPPLATLGLTLLAPVAAHLKWANLGYALTDDHFIAREGFWTRRTRVVPYYRVQTLVHSASVFQRRRELATLVVDTAGSQGLGATDARALDADAERARELGAELERRFDAALAESRDARRRRLETPPATLPTDRPAGTPAGE